MPWKCLKCGWNGRGIRARDSHEIYHLHKELAELKWREVLGDGRREETELCRLAKDLATKQRACDEARKALNIYIRNKNNRI